MVGKDVTRRGAKNESKLTASDFRGAGQKAWANGLPSNANPHALNPRLSSWWREGWDMAMNAATADAWKLGEEASRNGKALDDNPFPTAEPSARRLWGEGWQSGQDGPVGHRPRGKRR